jgi:hypothetical protein
MARVRRSLLFCLAVLALAVPAGADAAKKPSTTACRNKIINQWEGTGKIKTTYPIACYKAALKYVHGKADISTYSSLRRDDLDHRRKRHDLEAAPGRRGRDAAGRKPH